MATNPNDIPIIPSREQFGLPQSDDVRPDPNMPTVAVHASGVMSTGQWEWIMSSFAKLESRLAASEHRTIDHRVPPRPDPDPPYAVPLSSAVLHPQPIQQPPNTAVREFQFPPQPSITSLSHYHEVTATSRPPHTGFITPQLPLQYNSPPMYGSDPYAHARPYHPHMLPTNQVHSQYGPTPIIDRPFSSPMVGPRPTSCWYPSADRTPRGSHDQHRGVRLDPPRFDGTDTANWIFK